MEQTFILSQLLGILALISGVLAWQIKCTKKISLVFVGTDLLWAAQYFLLSAQAGAYILVLCVIRNGLAGILSEKYMKYVVFGFLSLVTLSTIMNFQQTYDLLPLLATIIYTTSLLKRDDRRVVARGGFLSNLGWTAYAALNLSFAGVLFGLFNATSTIIGMARHEEWEVGKCHRTFLPSLSRALFVIPNFRTYP